MSKFETPRAQRTRAAILDAAWELVAERGLDVGMGEIADRVGMTRQSLYVHFGSRGGLLIALVRRADEREAIHARFAEALAVAGPAERLDAFLSAWLDFVPVIHPVARRLIAAASQDEAAAAAWTDRMDELVGGFRRLTRSLARDGALAPGWSAARAADYLWAATSVSTWRHTSAKPSRSSSSKTSRSTFLVPLRSTSMTSNY